MEPSKSTSRRVLIATIAASSMGFLMQGSVSIALDAMQRDLNGSSTELLWVVNAYTLFLGALILVGGGLGDRYGRKRIFSIGVWGFGAACIFATVAPSMALLIAARVGQGVFGALMVPNSLALLSAAFDDDDRPRAIGLWSAFSTLASIIGPVVGGWLTGQGLWRGIFGLCIPFMLVAIANLSALPDQKRADAPPLDGWGAALATLSLACFVYAASLVGEAGAFSSPLLWGMFALGVGCAAAFVWQERRAAHPLLPLTVFASRMFSATNAYTFLVYGALGAAFTFLPLYLLQVRAYDPFAVGTSFLPSSLILVVLSPLAGRWAQQVGVRALLTAGAAVMGVAFIGFGFMAYSSTPPDFLRELLPWIVLQGVGLGLLVAPLTNAVMSAVDQRNAGIASGVNNAIARSSGALITALGGALLLVLFSSALTVSSAPLLSPAEQTAFMTDAAYLMNMPMPSGIPDASLDTLFEAMRQAYHGGYQAVMLASGGMCLLAALLAWWGARPDAPRPIS